MGRAKRLVTGTRDGAGMAIEYVRTRKVVRILGWFYDEPIPSVEIPLGDLCQQLGIDPHELGAPRRYLLFAGAHHRSGGGLRDLAGTFASEDKAWAAFRVLRQAHTAAEGWAELAAIDSFGQVTQLAWFGLHPAGEPAPPVVEAGRRRRGAGAGESPDYLRAVTPS